MRVCIIFRLSFSNPHIKPISCTWASVGTWAGLKIWVDYGNRGFTMILIQEIQEDFYHRRKIHLKKSTRNKKLIRTNFNHFCRVPDLCHMEEGKSSREFFEKVRVNGVFFGISGFWVGCWGLYLETLEIPQVQRLFFS